MYEIEDVEVERELDELVTDPELVDEREELDTLVVDDDDTEDEDVVTDPHEGPWLTENWVEYWYSPVPSTMMSMP